MIESDDFVKSLEDIGFDFFTGVPDSNLGGIIATLMERRLYTPAVREDEAVAIAAGAFMGGKTPRGLFRKSRLGALPQTLFFFDLVSQQPFLFFCFLRGFLWQGAP